MNSNVIEKACKDIDSLQALLLLGSSVALFFVNHRIAFFIESKPIGRH